MKQELLKGQTQISELSDHIYNTVNLTLGTIRKTIKKISKESGSWT